VPSAFFASLGLSYLFRTCVGPDAAFPGVVLPK
jgi:hypothetical protein